LLPAQRLLLNANKAVALGSRALDILIALAERPGELISNHELMARVWPKIFVHPGNLTVHIAALRRALGDGRDGNRFIVNRSRTRLSIRRGGQDASGPAVGGQVCRARKCERRLPIYLRIRTG
jgi:hypothetical protein